MILSSQQMLSLLTLGVLFSGAFMSGAVIQAEEPNNEKKITYDEHIRPILRQRCGSCHNSSDQRGGLTADTFAGVMQGGSSGSVIEPGESSSSRLYQLVAHDAEPKMPPNQSKIPDAELSLIKQWIDLGALENQGSKFVKKKSDLAKIEISTERPADAPVLPEGVSMNPVVITAGPNSVTALANSPWASLTAVSGQNQVTLIDTATGLVSAILPFPEGQPHILKFSRNGQLLLAGGGIGGESGLVVVWDVKTGNRVAELGDEYDSVLAADISADHTLVVLAGPQRLIRVYSVQTGEKLYELKKHTDWVLSAEFSPDGILLVTSDRSNGMFLWEALTGNEYLALRGHTAAITSVAWRPDSNIVASGSEDGTIRLWELNDGKEVKRWNAHGGGVSSIEFTRDANIVSIGRDKLVKLWDGEGKNLKNYEGLTDLGLDVTYDAELKRVLGGDWTGEVRVWDADSAAHLFSVYTNPVSLQEQLPLADQHLQKAVQAASATTAALQTLKDQIQSRQQAVAAAKAKLTETEQGVQTTAGQQAALEKSLAEAKAKVEPLKAAFDKLQAEFAAVEKTRTVGEQTAQTQAGLLQTASTEKSTLEGSLKDLQTKVTELEAQGESAAEQLQTTRQERDTVQKSLEEKSTQISEMEAQMKAAGAAVEKAKTQAADLMKQGQAAKTSLEQAVAAVQALEAQQKTLTETAKQQAAQKEAQQKAVAELEPKAAATEEETQKINQLTAQLQQQEQQKTRLQKHVAEIQKQLANPVQAAAN